MDLELARFNMIEQTIHPAVSIDPQVAETLGLVRRERFVPEVFRNLAYVDEALPLGKGEHMLPPETIGRLLQAVGSQRGESVLLIGAGSGYLAALLSVQSGSVHCLEIDPDLAALAEANLRRAGVINVTVEEGNGLAGCAECAPYDLIVATGAVESIPAAWLDQLKPGGRLFAFVGKAPVVRARLMQRLASGGFRSRTVFETLVDPLRGQNAGAFVF